MEAFPNDHDGTEHQGGAHPRHGWDERLLARLGRAQDGVARLDQLRAAGLGRGALRVRVGQDRLIRVHRTVYAIGHDDLTERGRLRAAAWACGPHGLVSGRAAAWLLGLWNDPVQVISVTVPRPKDPRPRGIVVHRTGVLLPADATHVRGIPCTSVSRTLVDLAAGEAPVVVEAVFERAEARRLVRVEVIDDLLRRKQRSPGAAVLRRLLETHRPQSGATRSVLERRLLATLRRAGVPEPVVNGTLELDGVVVQPDLMWPALRVLVEADGGTHATPTAMRRDRQRDRQTLRAGWVTLRFTWGDVERDADRVVADIRDVLEHHHGA